ncbi:hypothetical protein BVX97_03235 [bacterium E08(2017)]|nr:hypothetical protein BVX97_03235 [bacterium E08(2017)]
MSPFASRGITKYVRILLYANCAVFVVQLLEPTFFHSEYFTRIFSINTRAFAPWQIFTYMFLHGGWMHLLFNMVGLYMFGSDIEYVLGSKRFLRLYIFWGVIAGIGWLLIAMASGKGGICLGASGAILGILGCFAGLYPDRYISLLFPPITLKARTFVIALIVISALMMLDSTGNVAHSAHLFGCLAGYLFGMKVHKNPGILDAGLYSNASGPPIWKKWFNNVRAMVRHRSFTVITEDDIRPSQEEIDRILDKINSQGLNSLTIRERQILRKAGDKK